MFSQTRHTGDGRPFLPDAHTRSVWVGAVCPQFLRMKEGSGDIHILFWRVSLGKRFGYFLPDELSLLVKSPLLNFGKERKRI